MSSVASPVASLAAATFAAKLPYEAFDVDYKWQLRMTHMDTLSRYPLHSLQLPSGSFAEAFFTQDDHMGCYWVHSSVVQLWYLLGRIKFSLQPLCKSFG